MRQSRREFRKRLRRCLSSRRSNSFLPLANIRIQQVGKGVRLDETFDYMDQGIRKELNLTKDDFLKVVSRSPSTYLGFPFIVEAAIATGPTIRKQFKSGTNRKKVKLGCFM